MQSREIEHAGTKIEGKQQHPGDGKITKHSVKTIFQRNLSQAGQQQHSQPQAKARYLKNEPDTEPAVHRDIFVLLHKGGKNRYLGNDHQNQRDSSPGLAEKDRI